MGRRRGFAKAALCLFAGAGVATALWAPAPAWAQGAARAPVQRLAEVQSAVDAGRRALTYAMEQREEARDAKDIIRYNCVSDKATAISGLVKIMQQAQKGAVEAADTQDAELFDHHVMKVSIAGMQVENFRVELDGCMGESSQYTGDTQLAVDIDEEIRQDNPSEADPDDIFPAIDKVRPEALSGSECGGAVFATTNCLGHVRPEPITGSE